MNAERRWLLVRGALIAALLILLQWPFLRADADVGLGWSRGPYTDEGLYTAQVRNAMVTGRLDLAESDGVVKEPLFALAAWGVLSGFTDSMPALRAAVVLATSGLLALLAAGAGPFARTLRIAIAIGVLSYFPFHYSHLAMAEMPACVAIVGALWAIHRRLTGASRWSLFASALFVCVAYALKIQFIYAAALPPTAFAIAMLLRRLRGEPADRAAWADLYASTGLAIGFALVFLAVWVWPHRGLLDFVMSAQAGERTAGALPLPKLALGNLLALLQQQGAWPVLLLVAVGAVSAGWAAWRGADGARRRPASALQTQARVDAAPLLAPTLAWLLIEAHKFVLSYLPSRYLVSTLVAAALAGAALFVTYRRTTPRPGRSQRLVDAFAMAGLGLAVTLNAALYLRSVSQRDYTIYNAQRAFAADRRWHGQVIAGAWASALFWGSGAITKPVWGQYFNDRQILDRLRPTAIVSEPDQTDSRQAFARDGIELSGCPSPLRIRHWQLCIYPQSHR
jgi:hypothetical protein